MSRCVSLWDMHLGLGPSLLLILNFVLPFQFFLCITLMMIAILFHWYHPGYPGHKNQGAIECQSPSHHLDQSEQKILISGSLGNVTPPGNDKSVYTSGIRLFSLYLYKYFTDYDHLKCGKAFDSPPPPPRSPLQRVDTICAPFQYG